MSDYTTNFPPQTYSSSFYINALTEGDKTTLVSNIADEEENEVQVKNSPILDCFISTMKNPTVLLTIAFLSCTTSQTSPNTQTSTPSSTASLPSTAECIEDHSGKIRTFASLNDYQGSKINFNPNHPTYQGNVVQFSFKTIDSLLKNSFISFGSDSIMKIDLHDKSVQDVEPGAFLGLFCLENLDLSQNNISKLSEGSFEGLENLKKLDLSFNQLGEIPDDGLALITLKSLRELDLSNNKIKSLNRLSFTTFNNLEILNLGHNRINSIDPRVFNYLGSLNRLSLNDNFLVDASANLWEGLTNLTDLDLSNNYLYSFDMTDEYSFVNLKFLNLSGNNLQFINVRGIRRALPNLSSLDLSDNNWLCENLEVFRYNLKDQRITMPRPVNCSEVKTSYTKTVPVETTKTTPVVTTPASKQTKELEPILQNQHEKILMFSQKIQDGIQDLRISIAWLFIILMLFAVAEVGFKLGVCRSMFSQVLRRRNRGYLDANDVESVGLLSR